MAAAKSRLVKILDRLEKYYGKSAKPWPTDPYELVILRNSGYPQSDANCAKGFESLRKEIGIKPAQILAAPNAKLIKAIRPGVMFPEIAARRLKEIAAMVEGEFGGDLRAVLKRPLAEAKKAFKKFPTDRKSDRRQNTFVHKNRAGCRGAIKLRSRSAAARLRNGREELRAGLPRSAGSNSERNSRRHRRSASRVSPDQRTRPKSVQNRAAALRCVPRLERLPLLSRDARDEPVRILKNGWGKPHS